MYVGNLPFDVTELELREHFSPHGEISEVAIVMDNYTNRPRGFAFVTMKETDGMQTAIRQLDGKPFMGRPLKINEARPREERPARVGGGERRGSNRSRDRW